LNKIRNIERRGRKKRDFSVPFQIRSINDGLKNVW